MSNFNSSINTEINSNVQELLKYNCISNVNELSSQDKA